MTSPALPTATFEPVITQENAPAQPSGGLQDILNRLKLEIDDGGMPPSIYTQIYNAIIESDNLIIELNFAVTLGGLSAIKYSTTGEGVYYIPITKTVVITQNYLSDLRLAPLADVLGHEGYHAMDSGLQSLFTAQTTQSLNNAIAFEQDLTPLLNNYKTGLLAEESIANFAGWNAALGTLNYSQTLSKQLPNLFFDTYNYSKDVVGLDRNDNVFGLTNNVGTITLTPSDSISNVGTGQATVNDPNTAVEIPVMGNEKTSLSGLPYNIVEAVSALDLAFSAADGKLVKVYLADLGIGSTGGGSDPFAQLAADGFTAGASYSFSGSSSGDILDESTRSTAEITYASDHLIVMYRLSGSNGCQLDILPVAGLPPALSSPENLPAVTDNQNGASADISETASDYTLDVDGLSGISIDSVQLSGTTASVAATSSGELVWTGSDGTQYQFTPGVDFTQSGVGILAISGGALAAATGDSVSIDDFNLSIAETEAGFAGIHLDSDAVSLTCGSSSGSDPLQQSGGSAAAPNFVAGSSQSYTVTVATPSDSAQLVTVTLSGASPSDFALVSGTSVDPLNSDGTFVVTIPAGETSAAFTLANTGDVDGSASLTLTPVLTDPTNTDGNTVSGAALTQNYVEPTDDPMANPPTTSLFVSNENVSGGSGYSGGTTYYDDLNLGSGAGRPAVGVGSGSAYIDLGGSNESIVGGTGNDTILAHFDYYASTPGNVQDAGTNVIVGNGGHDVIENVTDRGDVLIYADAETDLASAIQDAQTAPASGAQGDLIVGFDGANDTVVGDDGDDLITNSTGDDVVVAGPGDDTIAGGVYGRVVPYIGTTGGILSDPPASQLSSYTWGVTSATQFGILASGVEIASTTDFASPTPGYEGNVDANGSMYGLGNETIFGGSGASTILLSNGNNYVDLGTGNSSVYGGMGDNTIYGGTGDVYVQAGGGNDYIEAGSGDDVLMGRGGNNTIVGGAGEDTIYAGSASTSGDPASWEISDTGSNDVQGGTGNSLIFGAGGSDTLIAGDGNSTVYGGAGSESIVGGSGDDLLVGGTGNDTIQAGGNGNDTLVAQSSATSTSVIYGGGGTDLIQGGDGTNTLYAGDGGTASAPTQVQADLNDAASLTTIYGGLGVDQIYGGVGTSVIYAGDGGSGLGPTSVIAGSGDTTVYGGAGVDYIQGGSGTDALYAGDGGTESDATTVVAGTGNATLYGGAGCAVLGDTVNGSDLLVAGSGDDTLWGIGNDTLESGEGDDHFDANSGNETYLFNPDFGADQITQSSGTANLEFAPGIEASDLTVTAGFATTGQAALEIDDDDSSDGGSLLVVGGLTGAIGNSITFEDPSTLTLNQLIAQDGQDETLSGVTGNLVFNIDDNAAISAGPSADTVSAWGNDDTIGVTAFDDAGVTIYAAGNGSQVTGGSGQDTLTAAGEQDSITSGSGNNQLIASGANDLLEATSGNDTLTATGSADSLVGGSGEDTLIAQGTNDTLVGGSGNDTFIVDDSSTTIQVLGGGGTDSVLASVNYTLPTNVDVLTLTGSSNLTGHGNSDASNTITGNAGNDTLIAGSGHDTLIAGTGLDTLVGGGHGDTFVVNNVGDVVQEKTGFGANDTVLSSVSFTLPTNVDTLTLTESGNLTATGNSDASNTITGNAGNDTLTAGGGQDTLIAGSGIDTLIGAATGRAGDTFVLNNTADVVIETRTNVQDTIQSSQSYVLPENVDTLMLTGAGGVSATGNNDAANLISVGSVGGNDTLIAGTGADTLEGSIGIDTLIAGSGADVLSGGAGDTYVLNAGFGHTLINASAGSGTLEFGAGITPGSLTVGATLMGGTTALVIDSGTNGTATVEGGLSGAINDFVFSDGTSLSLQQLLSEAVVQSTTVAGANGNLILNGSSAVSVVGGTDNDTLCGTGAGDTLMAGTGNDMIFGSQANDVLVGGTGSDTLYGGTGDDLLLCGAGNTTMYGGAGDVYVMQQGSVATIYPATTSESEALQLPAGMSFSDFSSYLLGNDLVIQSQDGKTSAIIKGYLNSSAASNWFVESDGALPELLSTFLEGSSSGSSGGSSQSPTGYAAEVSALEQGYATNLNAELQTLGAVGGSLGSLMDIRQPTVTLPISHYTFGGVTTDNVSVTGGVLNLSSSESGVNQLQTKTSTYTVTTPVYGLQTVPGRSYYETLQQIFGNVPAGTGEDVPVPPGTSLTPVFDGPPDPITTQPTLSGYVFAMSPTSRLVQTGTTSTTYTTQTNTWVIARNFTTYNVTGDGGNDTITSSGPFAGTVNTGAGNVYVNLGTTSSQGDWISGSLPGTSAPLFGSPSSAYAVQPGAFIQAGSGNDTLIGTNGDDVLAAGLGFDSMDGGNGGDTYIVPMQGYSTDVISDSGNPAPNLSDLLAGGTKTVLGGNPSNPNNPEVIAETPGPGQFPLDTLQLPAGISPQNLKYRVFTDPADPTKQILQLNSGNSNVLIIFAAPPVYKDEMALFIDYKFNDLTTPASLGVDLFQFSDGAVLTRAQLIAQATLLPNDFNPVVVQGLRTVGAQQAVAAAALFTATDAPDAPITWYKISDSGTGGGYFVLDGQAQSAGQSFMINAGQLAQLTYVGGALGTNDTFQVSAFDGAVWSAPSVFTVASAANVLIASAPNQQLVGISSAADTIVGGYSNDTLVGSSGQDTFVYVGGGGAETLSEAASNRATSESSLDFESGITPASITLGISASGELVLTIGGTGDSVSIAEFDPLDPLNSTGIGHVQFASGSTLSLEQLLTAGQVTGSAGNLTEPDGDTLNYAFNPSGQQAYTAQLFSGVGKLEQQFVLNSDGSTSASTYTYNADGSYSDTAVATANDGSVTTTVYGYDSASHLISNDVTNPDGSTADYTYNLQGQLTSAEDVNADGSTSDSTYIYNLDDSYNDTVVATATDGSVTTTVYGYDSANHLVGDDVTNPDGSTADYTYNVQGQLTSLNRVNADGSTSNSTYAYNSDGSYSDSVVATSASGSTTTTVYSYDSANQLISDDVTNPDGSTADYTYNAQGQLTSANDVNADGSSSNSTYSYDPDGSFSDTVVANSVTGAKTTTVYDYDSANHLLSDDVTNPDGATADYTYNVQGQLTSANVVNADGSTSKSTYTYNWDGSYSDAVVVNSASGATTTNVYGYDSANHMLSDDVTNPDGSTMDYTYNAQGQLMSADVINADGSTSGSIYTYNPDGSYIDTVVATSTASTSTTTEYGYDAEGHLLNIYTPSTGGSYTDSWSSEDGSHGSYWWNASTMEYQDAWYNSDGTYWTDEYQYAAGGAPSIAGSSYKETYTASDGSQGIRQFDASSGVTSLSWYSAETGPLSGTTADSGFIGLQNDMEATNISPDPSFFNPATNPAFQSFLTAH